MAKQIVDFDFKRGRAEREDKYPMEWLDGNIWELNQEEDFPNVKMSSFYSNIQGQAKRHGLKVRSRKDGPETIIIQSYPDPALLDPQDEGGPLAQKEEV